MENGKSYRNLNTNLQPSFWRKVQNIIRQNKKVALINFLFLTSELEVRQNFESTLKSLQNQVDSLQKRLIHLENQILIKEEDTKILSDTFIMFEKVPS